MKVEVVEFGPAAGLEVSGMCVRGAWGRAGGVGWKTNWKTCLNKRGQSPIEADILFFAGGRSSAFKFSRILTEREGDWQVEREGKGRSCPRLGYLLAGVDIVKRRAVRPRAFNIVNLKMDIRRDAKFVSLQSGGNPSGLE